jgi:GNAT superfamily N-acetyltransferase
VTDDWAIELLSRRHDRTAFDCGVAALDDFLKKHARQNAEQDVSRTYAAARPPSSAVLGFYSICADSIDLEDLPRGAARGLPRYSVPTAKLARLAVDRSAQGKGVGGGLLTDALARIARLADEIGICAVTVDAKAAEVRDFYLKFGFEPLLDDELHLFMFVRTIRQMDLG